MMTSERWNVVRFAAVMPVFRDAPERQATGARYLRDNIKYHLGGDERAGLEAFYRYAVEVGVVPDAKELRFY